MDQSDEVKEVKCIVWDLDNTIWDGTLLESQSVDLRPGIRELIRELDSRGILNSIASRNNYEDAWNKLKDFGIQEYFIYPEIHWNIKSSSIANILKNINISFDTIAFIDDSPFERDEVSATHTQVEVFDATDYLSLLEHPRFKPSIITEDARRRRLMYMEDIERNQAESEFEGPKEEFLRSLDMRFIIKDAEDEDLARAQELTIRTNQLNATGRPYSYDELLAIMRSRNHRLLVCELTDKYGSYGKIGLAVLDINPDNIHLRMMLMSCRVLSRSIGSVLMTYIMKLAKQDGKILRADFCQTARNKMMYVTYRFANFKEVSNDGAGNIIFENDLSQVQEWPSYIQVICPGIPANVH